MFNQGFVVYETYLAKKEYFFTIVAHDVAFIYIDGKYVETLDRNSQK
jgi:hypothetical protein